MAATIGKVRAVFTASSAGLTSGVNQAAASMRRMEGQISSLSGGMRLLNVISGAQLFGQIASSATNAVRSLVRVGQAEADVIDQTSKLAARLGLTYGELAGLSLAGDLAGVSMDQIGVAVTKADVAFVKAANGSKTAQAAFAQLGLSAEQLAGQTAADRFQTIADAIAAIPDPAARAAAAVGIFGRSGATLLPLFAGGAGAIRQATEEAQRFGLTLTNAQGQDVEAMNDSFTRVQKAIQGVIQQVVAYLAPAVERITTAFSDFVGSVGGANIGQAIGEGILAGARYLAQVGDVIIQSIPAVWQYAQQVGEYWSTVWGIAERVGQVFYGVGQFLVGTFQSIAGLIQQIAGRLANAAGKIAQFVPGMGAAGRSLQRAGERWMASAADLQAAGGANVLEGLGTAFEGIVGGQAQQAGEAMAGPLTSALDEVLARSRQAAAEINQAATGSIEVKQTVTQEQAPGAAASIVRPITEALRGFDSRSSEGIREMFRIMRGDTGNDVQEQQLRVQERILDELEEQNDDDLDLEVLQLAPAAGA